MSSITGNVNFICARHTAWTKALIAALTERSTSPDDPLVARALAEREPIQIPDTRDDRRPVNEIILRAGYRALLIAPLMRLNDIVGLLVVRRKEPGLFPKETIDLLKTFAAQSVLAIQNARLFSEIDEKSRQLEIESKHKSQFLANMSHELRTPLNAILGYTELILDHIYGEAPEQDARRCSSAFRAMASHLLGLINDVLDLSKIEAGQLTLVARRLFDEGGRAWRAQRASSRWRSRKSLAFKVDVPLELPIGHGDERRIAQVLLNLVGNAIKFTDAGEVAVKASAANGSFTVAVCDTGPGIARPIRPGSSTSSSRPTAPSPRRRAEPGSACRSPSGSSRCTEDGSGSNRPSGKARHFSSLFLSEVEQQEGRA